MSEFIIEATNLSKKYLIGHQSVQRGNYTALRDVIAREARNFARKAVDFFQGGQIVQGDKIEEFWALRDVSFAVRPGEVVGIIGRNGAGKTTLLKILSRITEPDGGRVVLRGRVASLLEVGTGFHPELTGRENIYLNGTILGMRRADIKARFDEIVAFAGIDNFLDTPVKRYSLGMYARLAFSVAAHMDPDVLVVDEVLAVGDAEFQKKCLGKMREVASKQGRTVLFVSHNMAAVESLCDSALLLIKGRCAGRGPTGELVQHYLHSISQIVDVPLSNRKDRTGSGQGRFVGLALENAVGVNVPVFRCGEKAVLHLRIENNTNNDLNNCRISVGIDNELGQRVALLDTLLTNTENLSLPCGRADIRITVSKMRLIPGRYRLTLMMISGSAVADYIEQAAMMEVDGGDFYGTGRLMLNEQGMFLLEHKFAHSPAHDERFAG
jgi:lipopolysaccharide transport system ATP-binding protein